jgi:hypothetical protein
MECMVSAGIDAVPVRWCFRQQKEKNRDLVQNVRIGRSCHSSLYLVEVDQMVTKGVMAMYPASTR